MEFADGVRAIAGWNQTLTDWRRFVSLEPGGCFLAEWGGEPAGTATTTCYGRDLAWIGMVLVEPGFRRRGIGRALLEHCIKHLREERKIRCVKLDATPEGQPLYEKLGFVEEWGLKRWVGQGGGDEEGRPRDDLTDEAMKLDREVFGADRAPLLKSLAQGGLEARVRSDGTFGLLRPGTRASYLGPVTAADTVTGIAVARELIEGAPRETVFWDLPDKNAPAIELARNLGYEPKRDLLRMSLGENDSPGDPARMFGIAEPGLG